MSRYIVQDLNEFWFPSHFQTDVTKVIRYSRKLPEKEASLVKVCHCDCQEVPCLHPTAISDRKFQVGCPKTQLHDVIGHFMFQYCVFLGQPTHNLWCARLVTLLVGEKLCRVNNVINWGEPERAPH